MNELLAALPQRQPNTNQDLQQSSHDAAIRDLRSQRCTHTGGLDNTQAFSWVRCIVALASYALLVSDVLRSGLGVQELTNRVPIEPSNLVFFGPYAYSVLQLNLTSTQSIQYWPYKYDTTSASMRASAEYLNISSWSPCLLYKEKCDEIAGLSAATVLRMIDTLVEGVRTHVPTSPHASRRRGQLMLRIKVTTFDRVHDYILWWFFHEPRVATTQAIYYSHSELLRKRRTLCSIESPYPIGCKHSWSIYRRSCKPSSLKCRSVGTLWTHLRKRVGTIMSANPNKTVDIAVFEASGGDFMPKGVIIHGRKFPDIQVLTRVRDCTDSCRTIAIDDYRYEAASIVVSTDWYMAVASLRAIGQTYVWIRVATLVVGCYFARTSEAHLQTASPTRRIAMTLRTMFLIPSQIVVYGSTLPISCYLLAHLIDARLVHDLLAQQFITIQGTVQLPFGTMVGMTTVAMRSVWVVASICHIILGLYTFRSWTPRRGIQGVAEFFIGIVAYITTFAHLRSTKTRHSRMLEIEEVVPSTRRVSVQNFKFNTSYGILYRLLQGSVIDIKCICVGIGAMIAISLVLYVLHHVFPQWQRHRMPLISSTLVPCTAGSLWKTNLMVVSWDGTILSRYADRYRRMPGPSVAALTAYTDVPTSRNHSYKFLQAAWLKAFRARTHRRPRRKNTSRVHDDLLVLDGRSDEAESMLYLMNLAVMSDPWTLWSLRIVNGYLLGIYESQTTQRYFLLPLDLRELQGDLPIDWSALRLVGVVNSINVTWWEVLQCG